MIRHFAHPATVVAVALAVLLFCAPLPFGSVTRWGSAAVQAVAFGAFVLAAITARTRDLKTVAVPVLALSAIAALGLLQSLSWPRMLTAALSPHHAGLRDAAGAGDITGRVPLSLAADVSARTALTWAAVAAVLVASAVAARRRHRRRWLAAAVLGAAVLQILYGSGPWISGSTEIWHTPVPGDPTRLRGTFVNPDHLAGYLEIALAVAFAWGWWGMRRARRGQIPIESRLALVAPPVAVWLILFMGLAFTGSRGGLAAAVVAVMAQGLLLAQAAQSRQLAPVGAVAALAGIGVVAAIGVQQGFGRLAATSAYEVTWNSRRQMYAATWDLWRDFPWLGAGLGAFRDAIPLTQPDNLRGTWWHAHSDWLELLATVGVVGAALFVVGLVLLVVRLARGWTADRPSEDRAAVLAALGALVSLAIHESIDFGLTMPATAVTLAALLGTASAACGEVGHERAFRNFPEEAVPRPAPAARPKRPRSRGRRRARA
jgi:putative inorganic carbon (hco3(-)) transporter